MYKIYFSYIRFYIYYFQRLTYFQTSFHSNTSLDAKYVSSEIRRKLGLIALDLIVWIEHAIERNECSVWLERCEKKERKCRKV